MPGEEAGGALGSFGDILVSGEVPALTLGLWVLAEGSGDAAGGGAWSGDTAGGGSGGVG